MLRSLNTGTSGLAQFQEKLDVIGNNIANSNTTGFKSARTDFADTFSQTLQAGGAGVPSMQIGTGVKTAAIKNQFTQGNLTRTGVSTDLAVSGDGFFVVKHPSDGGEFATRAGEFRLDSDGYLITNTGLRVQGFSDSGLSTRGDVQIDATGAPATSDPNATMTSFNIDVEGKVNVLLSDGSSFVRSQVLLQRFQDPQSLLKAGDNLYTNMGAAGPLGGSSSPQPEAPRTNGLGMIQAGGLEMSNVDLAQEFADLITTQRGFQANARIITTSDEILQELVNLKR